jgi:excisionase family DNA binding protein
MSAIVMVERQKVALRFSRRPKRTMTTSQLQFDTQPARLAFSVQETAQMLGICDKSVRRLIMRGLIRPSRALRHVLIPKDEVERFLRETK